MTPKTSLLLLPLLLTATSGPLRYAPEPGTTWRTRIVHDSSLSFSSLDVRMGGNDVPREFLPQLEIEEIAHAEWIAIDRILSAADDSRVTRFEREFDGPRAEVSSFLDMDGTQSSGTRAEGDGASALDGHRVLFELDAEDGTYSASWPEGEAGPDGWLDEAWLDLSLSALLPEDEAGGVGHTWTVDAQDLGPLLAFDATLGVEVEGSGLERWTEEPEASGGPTGELELERLRTYEEDGDQRVEVSLEGTYETWTRRTQDLSDIPVTSGTGTEESTSEFECEGTLVWSLSRNVPVTFELDAKVTITAVTTRDDPPSPAESFESMVVLVGSARWSLTAEEE